MCDGFSQQINTPQKVFNRQVNLFAAGFIGKPWMNFSPDAQLKLENGLYAEEVFGRRFVMGAVQKNSSGS